MDRRDALARERRAFAVADLFGERQRGRGGGERFRRGAGDAVIGAEVRLRHRFVATVTGLAVQRERMFLFGDRRGEVAEIALRRAECSSRGGFFGGGARIARRSARVTQCCLRDVARFGVVAQCERVARVAGFRHELQARVAGTGGGGERGVVFGDDFFARRIRGTRAMFHAARRAAQIFRARESLLAARVQAITLGRGVRRAAADAIAGGQRRILRADVDVEVRFFVRRDERHAHTRVAAGVVLHER